MNTIRTITTGVVAVLSAIALSGCMNDGYSRVGMSVGSGGYGGYGHPYYSGYGGYGYGWHDGYYYPGTGYYVYDRKGKRHRWNTRQRDYWANRGHDRRYVQDRDRRDRDRYDRQRWREREMERVRDRRAERPNWTPDRDRDRGERMRRSERGSNTRDRPR